MISLSKLSLIVLFFIAKVYAVKILEDVGNYDLVFHRFEKCEKRGKYDFLSNLNIGKLNRTHLIYTGTVDTGVDVDDKLKIHVITAMKGSNGRYSTLIDIKLKACDLATIFFKDVVLLAAHHCNVSFVCPRERVQCHFKDFIVILKLNNMPGIPYGDYRVQFTILRSLPYAIEERISCIRMYGAVKEQSSLL
ncbi:uncharacterized protein LOC120355482 [Nilaparvata lugens]|uniref:uncharacterized protein LOC120355482 n=1 Tax=Nilaparvata lugens TaxID=108931 RepID=UPI00193E54B0|nr:uncharacterized protein LOC120355482 [Nilaparvata lugens]